MMQRVFCWPGKRLHSHLAAQSKRSLWLADLESAACVFLAQLIETGNQPDLVLDGKGDWVTDVWGMAQDLSF